MTENTEAELYGAQMRGTYHDLLLENHGRYGFKFTLKSTSSLLVLQEWKTVKFYDKLKSAVSIKKRKYPGLKIV